MAFGADRQVHGSWKWKEREREGGGREGAHASWVAASDGLFVCLDWMGDACVCVGYCDIAGVVLCCWGEPKRRKENARAASSSLYTGHSLHAEQTTTYQ